MLNKNIPTFQLYNILTDLIDLRFADFQKQSVEVDKVIVPINFYPLPHFLYFGLNLRTPNWFNYYLNLWDNKPPGSVFDGLYP